MLELKVANKGCIRRISARSLRAAKTRNLIAVLAIALTTLLFMSLFSIAGAIVNSFQESTFRQVGGRFHGTFKDVTQEQIDELSTDERIKSIALRQMLGMPTDPPFNKAHVEVSWMDENCARDYFIELEEGHYPREKDEIIVDSRVLALLGVEPEMGAKIELPYYLGQNSKHPELRTDTFTLCGWWEYDPACVASFANVSRAYADEVLGSYVPKDEYDITGRTDMNIMLGSSARIREEMLEILADHGYQEDDEKAHGAASGEFIAIGVNWAYLGAQISENFDLTTVAAVVGLLLLIIFTGYLIIYNIFRISVSSDIQFYGLLKTIGTTGRQLKRIVRHQALALALGGIPIGLALGYFTGKALVPIVMDITSFKVYSVTVPPIAFLFAAAFSLVTVLISCRKPGKIASKVSAIEAVRYTEGDSVRAGKKTRRRSSGANIYRMAWANMGRSRSKTVLTVVSLALAVVLMQLTFVFANGFDMDKYLQAWVVTDFITGDASYFQTGGSLSYMQEEDIADILAQPGIKDCARIYGASRTVSAFEPLDFARNNYLRWGTPESVDDLLSKRAKSADGRVMSEADLYGMEPYAVDHLDLIEGDLAPLKDPSQRAVAAVYFTDDYGEKEDNTNWAKPGDKITLRRVDEWKYFYEDTGEEIPLDELDAAYENIGSRNIGSEPSQYEDIEYTVCAAVSMRNSMSFRFYGASQFVLGAETFKADLHNTDILNLLIDMESPEAVAAMEDYLAEYTETINPLMDYESKQSYVSEFKGFQGMFLTLGGALSFIVGLVGVLNFLNAVLTSIFTRRREFAVLQSIGMTGRQLKKMLMCEGLIYSGLAIAASAVFAVASGPMLGEVMGSMFWFFSYRPTFLPILCMLPVFALLGAGLPLLLYRVIAKQSIVERIRAND